MTSICFVKMPELSLFRFLSVAQSDITKVIYAIKHNDKVIFFDVGFLMSGINVFYCLSSANEIPEFVSMELPRLTPKFHYDVNELDKLGGTKIVFLIVSCDEFRFDDENLKYDVIKSLKEKVDQNL